MISVSLLVTFIETWGMARSVALRGGKETYSFYNGVINLQSFSSMMALDGVAKLV